MLDDKASQHDDVGNAPFADAQPVLSSFSKYGGGATAEEDLSADRQALEGAQVTPGT